MELAPTTLLTMRWNQDKKRYMGDLRGETKHHQEKAREILEGLLTVHDVYTKGTGMQVVKVLPLSPTQGMVEEDKK